MRRPLCLICLLFVLLIMVFMPLFYPYLTEKALPENHSYASFTGTISEIESTTNGKSVLYLTNRKQGLTVLCYTSSEISRLKIGNTIRANGLVRHFEQATNDGQFDARLYYKIFHIDYAMSDCEWVLTEASCHPFFQMLHEIKMKLGESLDAGLSEDDAGVLKAMLLGDKKSMTPSVKELYQRNGIAHIIAISGLHITLWGMGFCRLLKRLYVPLPIANFISFLFVVFYGLLTGSQASAIRSIIMFALFLLAPVVRRTYDMMTAMSLSAALLLFFNPLYIYYSGFLLSFFAVAGIVFLNPCLIGLFVDNKLTKYLFSSLSVSISVTLATLPIQIYFFYTVPLYSLFLNLFVTPLVGIVLFLGMCGAVVGCFTTGLPGMGRIFLYPCHIILTFYEKVCAVFDMLPLAHPVIAKPAIWRMVLYYVLLAGIMVLVKQRMKKSKKVSARVFGICFLILNIALICINFRFCTKITMLDVGQGDCFVIEAKGGKNILIDGGSSSVQEVGKYRIIPFLRSHGIARLDYIFLSHSDSDHINGVSEILQNTKSCNIKVSCLVLSDSESDGDGYGNLLSVCAENKIRTARISEGDYLNCKEVSFLCLHPTRGNQKRLTAADDTNGFSEVWLMECQDFKMLFTGDLPEEKESDMRFIDRSGNPIGHIDILKVAHHGSRYSTSSDFLQKLSPTAAFISAGKENRYGHPHAETLDRLKAQGCKIFRTDENGAVTVMIKGKKIITEKFVTNLTYFGKFFIMKKSRE